MSRLKSDSLDAFAVTIAIEVDRVCTDFDRALRSNQSPRIEDFLLEFQGQAREKVLAGLLALDMEHRVGLGELPPLHEYQVRFPNDLQLVKSVYVQAVMPTHIGRFEVEKVLGKGGFGCVYLAYDKDLKRHVAIKMLFGYQHGPATPVHSLLQEARLAASLKHAAIVPVYEVGQDEDGDHFVVLEYIEGTTLKSALRDKGLSLPQILQILIVVAEALQYAHERGLTHRDLKPANILIDRQHRSYITDFGLAIDESMQQLRAGEVAGTPSYMAPEQAAGETHRVDGRTDIWAFGVILYEVLTRGLPFSGESRDELFYAIRHVDPRPPRQRDGSIPARLERITLTCLAKRMSERYSSAADLAADLRTAQSELALGSQSAHDGSIARNAVIAGANLVSPISRVIPKGLRSFDVQDAAFFLRLLPEPRDSNGLPESIRFWQTRINETDEDATFSIGLIYGPSGCGKSSFVKAGLLPRLAEHVIPVVIESTRDETELRLLKALRKLFPDLPDALALPEIIAGIREERWGEPGRKVVIVLDQFEQWLHANPVQEGTQLTDALRQCDGGRVQTIVLVRDDFWMQLTRLLRVLEVPLIEGSNSAAVDLFDVRHAAKVLGEFGIAYGKLPEQVADWTDGQRRFIDQAVDSLAVDGRVVPVRLALFVEMIKGREWTPRMLKEIGGAEGTGVAFLEEAFAGHTAAPEHRLHQPAARAVLECLLPPEGTDIRGNMRIERDLLEVSGYNRSPLEFTRLLGILDTELRLITPTDPAGQSADAGHPTSSVVARERHYQLTHDYLVPAIRAWLTRSKRNSARGRAELRLAERAAAYRAQPHVRQLPNTWEWLSILSLTRNHKYEESERRLLRFATRYHARRIVVAIAVGAILAWIAYESAGRLRAAGYLRSLAIAETNDVPKLIRDVVPLRRWVDPQLRTVYADGNDKERLHAAMALLPIEADTLDYLLNYLLVADADSVEPIRKVILDYGDREIARRTLWNVLEDSKQPPSCRLRAAAGLANDPFESGGRWSPVANDLFGALIDDVTARPGNFDRWLELLRPIGGILETPAKAAFANNTEDRKTRYLVAAILANLNKDRIEKLVHYVVEADPDQFRPLQSAILPHSQAATPLLTRIVHQPVAEGLSEADKDQLSRRQANAAVSLFELGHPEALESALIPSNPQDRRLQTWMIERFSLASSSDAQLRRHLEVALNGLQKEGGEKRFLPSTAEARYAWTLIAGDLADRLPQESFQSRIVEILERIYQSDPDAGVHSAAEWALRRWGANEAIIRVRETLAGRPPLENGGWYVNSSLHTMVLLKAPGKITTGSPKDEPGREKDEAQRQVVIKDSFSVCTTEITQDDFCRLVPELSDRFPNDFSADSNGPANDITLPDAMKYCRRLSESERIPEEEMCYPAVEEIGDNYIPDFRRASKTGYRLLTNAEWEHACRAGSSTPRFYGFDPNLLDRYAWYVSNSGGLAHEVGMLKPNRFGLFDVYGNVREWTIYPTALMTRTSTGLGGSYAVSGRMLRSANWRADPINYRGLQNGFRIGRTWKEAARND